MKSKVKKIKDRLSVLDQQDRSIIARVVLEELLFKMTLYRLDNGSIIEIISGCTDTLIKMNKKEDKNDTI